MRLRKLFLPALVVSALVGVGLLHGHVALAQEFDFQQFGEQAGFSTTGDIRLIIARLIRTIITFLGVITVLLVLYGGFVWMTAGGNEERVKKAKRILTNAVIGLIIVLASFTITQFILNAIVTATGGGTSTSEEDDYIDDGDGGTPGGVFLLESINTECAEALQNLELQLVFSHNVSSASVEEGGISVLDSSGAAVEGTFDVSGSRVTFTPAQVCESEPSEFCFDADADYTVALNASVLENTSGTNVSCTIAQPCEYDFHTGSGVDTTGPILAWDVPVDGDRYTVGEIVLLQSNTTDDTGVSSVAFEADGALVYTAGLLDSTVGGLATVNTFFTDNTQWDTAGYVSGREYSVEAIGLDCAGHEASSGSIDVRIDAANCSNGVLDDALGETDVDCGGDSDSEYYCGACEGGSCEVDSDCSTGMCVDGACVTTPQIEEVSPGDGAGGNYITISGEGFGAVAGQIVFEGVDDPISADLASCGTTTWTDTEIIVVVPGDATDGPISVTTADGETERTDDDYGPYIPNFDINQIVRPGICSVLDTETGLNSALGNSDVTVSGNNLGEDQGTSTLYFTNYEASSYLSWGNEAIEAVVPLLDARTYRTQVFAGDYVCLSSDGASTGTVCSTDEECNVEAGETCATQRCSESDTYCSTDADCAEGEGTCESLRQGSNEVNFTVTSVTDSDPPVISYIDTGWATCDDGTACSEDSDCSDGSSCTDAANWGPVGQYMTIYGTGFGTSEGTVRFVNAAGGALNDTEAIGGTDFPDACSDDFWHTDSITVKVPEDYLDGSAAETGAHTIYVIRGEDGIASDSVEFNLVAGTPGPSVCSVEPAAGPVGTAVEIVGDNFGDAEGDATVTFFDAVDAAYTTWDRESITTTVPDGAETGPVTVTEETGFESNSVSFEVGDCREDGDLCTEGTQCCSDGSCRVSCESDEVDSHYAYRFSTGTIPETPTVLVYCGDFDEDGNMDGVSPSPWEGWSVAEDVCINAAVTATFSVPMDEATINGSNITVEKCIGDIPDECGTTEVVSVGELIVSETSFQWTPDGGVFDVSSTYQVTLNGGEELGAIQSAGGGYMESDYSWQFETASSEDFCEIGEVYVSPSEYTVTEDGAEVDYVAQPLAAGDACVALACGDYTWTWDTESDAVTLGGSTACTEVVTAVDETPSGDPAIIEATVDATNSPSDSGELIVSFVDPEIVSYVPSCGTACVNAAIVLTFNTPMANVFSPSNVRLYACEDATCEDGLTPFSLSSSDLVYSQADPTAPTLTISHDDFDTDTYYRIVVAGALESASGVPLSQAVSRCTELGEACTFKTTDSAEPCTVDRVEVSPESALMSYVGERQEFTATAYGQPDDCSPIGQVLDASDYNWSDWTATDDPDTVPAADVAFLLPNGGGDIALVEEMPNGCSTSCLNTGAPVTINDGVCGDGSIGPGEDCDDSNSTDGDGCSSICQREGANGTYGTCGDGIVDQGADGEGEDCDGGEACSDVCTNLGTSALDSDLAECGDGTIDYSEASGGEDCDDGNNDGFDGCSSTCVNEGSTPIALVFAICGNEEIETGEDCDDGDVTNGDGCSSVCLREGAEGTYGTCGDGTVDQGANGEGEDCDGEEGCSEACLWEGSSVNYEDASFCGDAEIGTAEECDATDAGYAVVGAYAVAEVDTNAVQEVNEETGLAVSDIGATVNGIGGEGELALSCSCETDAACGATGTLGCGTGSCCFARPRETAANPSSNSLNVCRNTAVWVQFDQMIDEASLDTSVDSDGDGVISPTEYHPEIALQLVELNGVAVGTTCPTEALDAGYYNGTYSYNPHNILARAWFWAKNSVRRLFGRDAVAASANGCLVPVTYTVEETTGEGSLVRLNFENALLENAEYYVNTAGDTNESDAIDEGVTSIHGVSVAIDLRRSTYFTTGTEICELEEVSAEDLGNVEAFTNELVDPSSGYFSSMDEEHVLMATAYTVRSDGTLEEISPISDYDWDWSWGSDTPDSDADNIVTVDGLSDSYAGATPAGANGEETAIASATITANDDDPTDVGSVIYGSVDLTVLLCENPWPSADEYPYIEETVNFSFAYCRDAGESGTADDLPAIDAVAVESPLSGIYAEYLYQIEDTNDALGVRVIPNESYLSPRAWYDAQGFTGNPSEDEVDGYEAIRDGNTYYVAVGNVSDASGDMRIYPNIYVISYNDNASSAGQDVFDQMLATWSFNADETLVTDVSLCYDGTSATYLTDDAGEFIACSWDAECQETCVDNVCTVTGAECDTNSDCVLDDSIGATCDAEKEKLTRDTRRLTDLTSINSLLEAYGDENGHCSVTSEQVCEADADCPSGEECVPSIPTISEGSYIRSATSSTWPSWSSVFGNDLGTALPEDPINAFMDCPAGYDADTCWNADDNTFVCPEGSHMYAYHSIGLENYDLFTQLEYDAAPWFYDYDTSSTDAVDYIIEYVNFTGSGLQDGFEATPVLCSASLTHGDSSLCGDGVIGALEVCEIGGTTSEECDVDGDGTTDGRITVACNASCSGFEDPATLSAADLEARCVQYACGNGVVEDGEDCDDGELNGTYGHCSDTCGASTFYCGDGYLAGGEACDCGTVANFSDVMADGDSWASAYGCETSNGQYAEDLSLSCAFDCSTPGPSCGDAEINGPEECDGGYEEWDGALCADGTQCTTDSDCDDGSSCGDGGASCGVGAVCIGGTDESEECTSDADCGGGGTCSAFEYELTRTRTCKEPGTANQCEWRNWSACKGGDQVCGNGIVEGDEPCDDGNTSNNDACLNTCEANICGDDYVYTGVESCDAGDENGELCDPTYGGSCNFCTATCQYQTTSGSYCGDGVRDEGEACDGSDVSYFCFDNAGGARDRAEECDPEDAGTQGDCAAGYICRQVGVCNGGTRNGEYCTRNNNGTNPQSTDQAGCGTASDGIICEMPICADDCGSTCPYSYVSGSVLAQSELAGATQEEEVALYSYLSGETPDNAVLYIPACEVGTQLTATVSLEDVIPPSVNIVFVTDLSGSMQYEVDSSATAAIGERRLDYVVESTVDAIDELLSTYEADGGDMQIALVSFGSYIADDGDAGSDGGAAMDLDFTDDKDDLIAEVESYLTRSEGGTPTGAGLARAHEALIDADAAGNGADVEIVILLSDGQPSNGIDNSSCSVEDCVEEAADFVEDDLFFASVYSAVIADEDTYADLIGYMAHFSSDTCGNDYADREDCEPTDLVEYAYQADDADEIEAMYTAIIDAILGLNVAFTTDVDGVATVTTGSVREGTDVLLPFPEGFECTGSSFTIPVNVSFEGTGTASLRDFLFTHCPTN